MSFAPLVAPALTLNTRMYHPYCPPVRPCHSFCPLTMKFPSVAGACPRIGSLSHTSTAPANRGSSASAPHRRQLRLHPKLRLRHRCQPFVQLADLFRQFRYLHSLAGYLIVLLARLRCILEAFIYCSSLNAESFKTLDAKSM